MNQLLKAAKFAAKKHSEQRRNNSAASPYINHPIEVAEHLASVGNISDEAILIAALLHDTIEDTNTTNGEIEEEFGKEVLRLVLECTDDKSLEKMERKRLQIVNAPEKSAGAKLIKIADKTCNLRSILVDPPMDWPVSRRIEYFQWASQVIDGLRGLNPELDNEVDAVIKSGTQKLKDAEQGAIDVSFDYDFDGDSHMLSKNPNAKNWKVYVHSKNEKKHVALPCKFSPYPGCDAHENEIAWLVDYYKPEKIEIQRPGMEVAIIRHPDTRINS